MPMTNHTVLYAQCHVLQDLLLYGQVGTLLENLLQAKKAIVYARMLELLGEAG